MDLQTRLAIEKEILKKSPYLLGKNVLGFTRYSSTHKEWDKWIRKNIDLTCRRPSKNLVLMPRETFKTTFFSINLNINILLNNPNISILIASSTAGNAANIVRSIRTILERNEKLQKIFGNFVTKDSWGTNEFTIAQRTNHTSKEPSVTGIGKGSILTSRHYDVIIADDIVSSDDRDSAAARDSTLRWFTDLWDLLKKENGIFIMPGTRWHKRDLYWHIMENVNPELAEEKKFNIIVKPAHAEDGTLNFPEILSEEKLTELKAVKIGADALSNAEFEAQYELRPISSSEQIFKTFHYYSHAASEYEIGIMYIDPAISTSQNACYSACVIVARIKNGEHRGKWAVPYASLEKRAPTKLMHDIIELHKLFTNNHCECVVFMETNNFQALLKDNTIKMALQEGYSLPITGKTTTTNKDLRISSLEPYITQGFLLFRDDWKIAPSNYRLLMDQLQNFPQLEKDGPDALAMGHEVSRGRYYNMELETTEANK